MDFQVDIYQCTDEHVHVVLRGQSEGKAYFDDFQAFAKFVEVCREFIERRAPIPELFLDAFDNEL